MPRIVHFEIPADDPQRAAAFYKKAFGWKIEKWPGPMEYWMVTTGPDGTPGINGGLMKKEMSPQPPTQSTSSPSRKPSPRSPLRAVRKSCRRRLFLRSATLHIARIPKEICLE